MIRIDRPAASRSQQYEIVLQPKELEARAALEGNESLIGFGGARGSAKSHMARSLAILRRFDYPGTSALVFRRTSGQLWENQIRPALMEWPWLKQYWSAQHNAFMLPGNSIVLFRYADTLKDILEFRGREYGDVFIDEATDLTEEEMKIIFSSCRSTVKGFTPKKVLTFNPGGVGHSACKRWFIDRELTKEEEAWGVKFIQGYAWDNFFWAKDELERDGVGADEYYEWPLEKKQQFLIERTSYGKELNALPKDLRDAWLWGRWDIFAGQYFDLWNYETHTFDESEFKLDPWWPKWISGDWGFTHDAVIHWHAWDGTTIYTYREWTGKRCQPEEIAAQIIKSTPIDETTGKPAERFDGFYFSPDAFGVADSERTISMSIGEKLAKYGFPQPTRADNDRIGGWVLMYQALKNGTWKIGRGCTALTKSMPRLIRNFPDKPDDVKKVEGDDAPDCARYGLKTYQRRPHEPIQLVLNREIDSQTSNVAQFHTFLRAKEKYEKAKELKGLSWASGRSARSRR